MLLFCRRLLFLGLVFCLQSEAQYGIRSCHDCVRRAHAWYISTERDIRECVPAPMEGEPEPTHATLTTDASGCEKLSDKDNKGSMNFDELPRKCSDCVKKREGSATVETRWVIQRGLLGTVSSCVFKTYVGTLLELAQAGIMEKPEVFSECNEVPPQYLELVVPEWPIEKTSCGACISSEDLVWCNDADAIFCMLDYPRISQKARLRQKAPISSDSQAMNVKDFLCPGELVTQCNTLGTGNRKRQLGKYPNDCDGCVKAGGKWCMVLRVETIRYCVPMKFVYQTCLGKLLTDCTGLTAANKKETESFNSHTSSPSSSGLSIFLILALVLTL